MTRMPPTSTGTGIENLLVSLCGLALSAANSHLPDQKRGSGHGAAKLQVGTDSFHIHQHIIQISSDCNFGDGKSQLAIANPEAGRAARVVARNDVDARPDRFGHIEAVPNAA